MWYVTEPPGAKQAGKVQQRPAKHVAPSHYASRKELKVNVHGGPEEAISVRQDAESGWWAISAPSFDGAFPSLHECDLEKLSIVPAESSGCHAKMFFRSETTPSIRFVLCFIEVTELRVVGSTDPERFGGQVVSTDGAGDWYDLQTLAITVSLRSQKQTITEVFSSAAALHGEDDQCGGGDVADSGGAQGDAA